MNQGPFSADFCPHNYRGSSFSSLNMADTEITAETGRRPAQWDAETTKHLLELVLQFAHLGKTNGYSLTAKAWRAVSTAFNNNAAMVARMGSNITEQQLKNRFSALRSEYITLKFLLGLSQARWEDDTVVLSEEVWKTLLQDEKGRRKYLKWYRGKKCPFYACLQAVFHKLGDGTGWLGTSA